MPELEMLDDEIELYVEDEDEDGLEYDALAEIEQLLESVGDAAEYDEYDEDDAERRRRRRGRGRWPGRRRPPGRGRPRPPAGKNVSTAAGQGLYQRPPSRDVVTHAQLKQALDKVGGEIRKNATAIKAVNDQVVQVNGRVSEVNSRLGGRIDTVSAATMRQNKAIASLRRQQEGLQQGLLFSALLGGGSRTLKIESVPDGGITKNAEITVRDAGDKFERLLPVLASSGGFGGGGGSNNSAGGLMANPLMMILLLDRD